MPSAIENDLCRDDPNYAVICSFLQHYADILKIINPTFKRLQEMIESKSDGKRMFDALRRNLEFKGKFFFFLFILVATELVDTVMRLLYKCNIYVDRSRWERRLAKFCRIYSTDDANQIMDLGFRNLKTSVKLRVIKV